jgi:hypothetical protein
MVLKSIARVALVRKAADEIRITIFFKSFGAKKIKELIVLSNKLPNNFAGLIANGLVPDVARGPPVGHAFLQSTWGQGEVAGSRSL